MRKSAQGFTLIELIMVIVILGILAAFALPRFANLGSEARIATMQGAAASIKSGAAIAHAQALAQSRNTAGSDSVTIEGSTIDLIFGYPEAKSGSSGILEMAQISTDDFDITSGSSAADTGGGVVTISAKGFSSCTISYTSPAAANGSYSVDVSSLTSGNC